MVNNRLFFGNNTMLYSYGDIIFFPFKTGFDNINPRIAPPFHTYMQVHWIPTSTICCCFNIDACRQKKRARQTNTIHDDGFQTGLMCLCESSPEVKGAAHMARCEKKRQLAESRGFCRSNWCLFGASPAVSTWLSSSSAGADIYGLQIM